MTEEHLQATTELCHLLGTYSKAWKLGRAWLIVTEDDFIFIFPAALFLSPTDRKGIDALLEAAVLEAVGGAREKAVKELRELLLATYFDLAKEEPSETAPR